MDGRWILMVMGPFLAVVIARDVLLAWKHQCFRKGPGQLWDVSRVGKPIVFWFLIVANVSLVCLGIWLAASSAIEIWTESNA